MPSYPLIGFMASHELMSRSSASLRSCTARTRSRSGRIHPASPRSTSPPRAGSGLQPACPGATGSRRRAVVRLNTIVLAFGVLMPEIDFASPFAVRLEALDHVEVERVLPAVLRVRETLERVLDVARGDLAVDRRTEPDAGLESERPRLATVRRLGDGTSPDPARHVPGGADDVVVPDQRSHEQVRVDRDDVREVLAGRVEAVRSSRTSTPSRRGRYRPWRSEPRIPRMPRTRGRR